MKKRFKIITLGCKVNQYESAFIEESLVNKGCQIAGQDKKADLVIINGCIVTATASYQSRQAIRRAIRENPQAIISVVGCYGQVFPDELSKINGVDLIVGNKGKSSVPELLINAIHHNSPLIFMEDFSASETFEHIPVKRFSSRTRAFLKIQDGCQSFCTYCIVPMARGPVRSLEPDNIITILKDLEKNDYREIVLTGIHLGKYGSDLPGGINLTKLLIEIGKNSHELRIRLSSLRPTEISTELIELMISNNWLCRHFHISLQSGDDSVLKRMNRYYTARMFVKLIDDIHNVVPKVSIGVDVLVGFPGESETSFNNTYKLLKDLPVSYLHVFPYSRREGTAAAQFSGHLDHKLIKERAFLLRSLDKEKRRVFRDSLVGQTFSVLAEGWAPREKNLIWGLSDNYVRFYFPAKSLIKNNMVKVKAESVIEEGIIAQQVGT
jgi:threonylcarbamoyladenosine tRNA methylthiotransferase MtaB